MLIAVIAIASAFAGMGLAYFAQNVEAKYADQKTTDDWSNFVATMGGNRR